MTMSSFSVFWLAECGFGLKKFPRYESSYRPHVTCTNHYAAPTQPSHSREKQNFFDFLSFLKTTSVREIKKLSLWRECSPNLEASAKKLMCSAYGKGLVLLIILNDKNLTIVFRKTTKVKILMILYNPLYFSLLYGSF